MKTAQVVIGANYGDEGKGLITDFLASQTENALVIRHNSSAQAGHTVVAPAAQPGKPPRRHVFHHVGSGAMAGASTFLSQFFVVHPLLLGKELTALDSIGVTPTLYVDPRAPVAVPFDVMINHIAEAARGTARHGSCGIGFNEAVERSLRPRFALTVRDFAKPEWVMDRLRAIRDGWVPRRLRMLGLDVPEDQRALFSDDTLLWRWMQDMAAFRARTIMTEPGALPPGQPIFEGAQGLMLDEAGADFPHVTRSKTGLANVIRIAQEVEINHLEITYVTRTYLTRHGAGPMPGELRDMPHGVQDSTNQPNAFQGSLRFAWLDLDALAQRIHADLAFRAQGITATAQLAVTCLDQMQMLSYRQGGALKTGTQDQLVKDMQAATNLPAAITSYGPRRTDVQRRGAGLRSAQSDQRRATAHR